MIFLTIGSHEPFDRLVRAVDDWARASGEGRRVFGQITARAGYLPRHFEHVTALTPTDYGARCAEAELIVSHAGMGTILTALQTGTPALLLQRKGGLGDTRNGHQIATAKKFEGRPGLTVVMDEADLPVALDRCLSGPAKSAGRLPPVADPRLISTLRDFIFQGQS